MTTDIQTTIRANAGLLIDAHAMCWMRTLKRPIEDVWAAVSTLEGLQQWWILPGCAAWRGTARSYRATGWTGHAVVGRRRGMALHVGPTRGRAR